MGRTDEEIKVDIVDQLSWDTRVDAADVTVMKGHEVVGLRFVLPSEGRPDVEDGAQGAVVWAEYPPLAVPRYPVRQNGRCRLPILDRAKRLVGIVSLGDLAVRTGEQQQVGETLEQVSEPAQPQR